jgi:ATP-dependent DNA helicase RecG
MGEWSKRVPTDISIYERHESVPHNPKIADVSFRSGDVESWGRGYLKIKADCKHINAELPMIDANGGGVSVTACGCEKYMRLLRYGQYGQVGVDGVWRDNITTQATTQATQVTTQTNNIQKQILDLIKNNGELTQKEIAEKIGENYNTVKYHIQQMKKKGIIERIGTSQKGHWEVRQ